MWPTCNGEGLGLGLGRVNEFLENGNKSQVKSVNYESNIYQSSIGGLHLQFVSLVIKARKGIMRKSPTTKQGMVFFLPGKPFSPPTFKSHVFVMGLSVQ